MIIDEQLRSDFGGDGVAGGVGKVEVLDANAYAVETVANFAADFDELASTREPKSDFDNGAFGETFRGVDEHSTRGNIRSSRGDGAGATFVLYGEIAKLRDALGGARRGEAFDIGNCGGRDTGIS
jgi:hypothetical protein